MTHNDKFRGPEIAILHFKKQNTKFKQLSWLFAIERFSPDCETDNMTIQFKTTFCFLLRLSIFTIDLEVSVSQSDENHSKQQYESKTKQR